MPEPTKPLPKFGGSPYQYAKELVAAGVEREQILLLLVKAGLAASQAKVIANSVGEQEFPQAERKRASRHQPLAKLAEPDVLPTGPLRKGQPDPREAIAKQLKADGYTGGVVARRLIEEHGMGEEEASALVGRVFGKKVNARGGDTTTAAVIIGIGLAGAGAVGVLILFSIPFGGVVRKFLFLPCLGLLGTGVSKVILALVNAGMKDDLRERRE